MPASRHPPKLPKAVLADDAKRAHLAMKRMLHHMRPWVPEFLRQHHIPELLVSVRFPWVQAKIAAHELDELLDQGMLMGDCAPKFNKCFLHKSPELTTVVWPTCYTGFYRFLLLALFLVLVKNKKKTHKREKKNIKMQKDNRRNKK